MCVCVCVCVRALARIRVRVLMHAHAHVRVCVRSHIIPVFGEIYDNVPTREVEALQSVLSGLVVSW